MKTISLFRRRPDHLSDEDLSALLDGAPRSPVNARARDHVDACEACSGRLEELSNVRALLTGLPAVVAPRSFALTPTQAAAGPAKQPAASGWLRVPAFAPAVALTLLLAVVAADVALVKDGDGSSVSPAQTTLSRQTAVEDATKAGADQASVPAAPQAPMPALIPPPATGGGPSASPPGPALTPAAPPRAAGQAEAVPSPSGEFGRTTGSPEAAGASASAGAAPAPAGEQDSADEDEASTLLRVVEVSLAVLFVVMLAAVLKPRLFKQGD